MTEREKRGSAHVTPTNSAGAVHVHAEVAEELSKAWPEIRPAHCKSMYKLGEVLL
jgi:hypothetical protein